MSTAAEILVPLSGLQESAVYLSTPVSYSELNSQQFTWQISVSAEVHITRRAHQQHFHLQTGSTSFSSPPQHDVPETCKHIETTFQTAQTLFHDLQSPAEATDASCLLILAIRETVYNIT